LGVYIGPHDSNSLEALTDSDEYSYTEYSKKSKDKYHIPQDSIVPTIEGVYNCSVDTHHKYHLCTSLYSYNQPFKGIGLVVDGFGQGYSEKVYNISEGKIDTLYSGNPGCSIGNLWNILGITYFDYPMHANCGKAGTLMALAGIGEILPNTLTALNAAYSLDNFSFLIPNKYGQTDYVIDTEAVKEHFGEFKSKDLANLCRTLQEFTNITVQALVSKHVVAGDTVMFAGGVSHNVVLIKHLEDTLGIKLFTGFAQGDEGISLGEYLFDKHITKNTFYTPVSFRYPYSDPCIEPSLPYSEMTTDMVCNGIIAVYMGAPEVGNRALGHRSFLADPAFPGIKGRLDRLKKREGFRPYGVMMLQEETRDWLLEDITSPYMNKLGTPNTVFISKFPELVHRDGTVRVQTITEEMYPEIYRLLSHFKVITGNALLVNTSLNISTPMLYRDDEELVKKMVDTNLIQSCFMEGVRYAND
jgi:carbamoyltransferase